MIVVYTENMLKLESSAMGELVRSTLLMAVVDRLIDLDVSQWNCRVTWCLKIMCLYEQSYVVKFLIDGDWMG